MVKNIKLDIDTRQLDRLVIGARLYDALTLDYECVNFNRIIEYDGKEKVIKIKESDLLKLIQLTNNDNQKVKVILIEGE